MFFSSKLKIVIHNINSLQVADPLAVCISRVDIWLTVPIIEVISTHTSTDMSVPSVAL